MKLYAISDLHLSVSSNRAALEALPAYPQDWLIIAGDIGETVAQLDYALAILTQRFAKVIWVPGNHDLWTLSSSEEPELRGQKKYLRLVAVCQQYGVQTPEDPYLIWPGEGPQTIIAPLFLLYDYSFRPADIAEQDAVAWAAETKVVCTDEYVLYPDPYPSRIAWCHARCALTERRLQAIPPEYKIVLINHFPLRRESVRVGRIPRFSVWCGTTRTADWHTRFAVLAVVSGHVHVRTTDYIDGVRFEEVSLGYRRDWQAEKGIQGYLREILPGPAPSAEPHELIWYR
jgi:Predicted phosphohydrolases